MSTTSSLGGSTTISSSFCVEKFDWEVDDQFLWGVGDHFAGPSGDKFVWGFDDQFVWGVDDHFAGPSGDKFVWGVDDHFVWGFDDRFVWAIEGPNSPSFGQVRLGG